LRFALTQLAAAPATIDAIDAGADWTVLAVADDEALWLGSPDTPVDPAIEDSLRALEPGVCLVNVTDGWAGLVLRGAEQMDVFAALSPLPITARENGIGFVQGDVLGLPAKVLVLRETIVVLYPATATAYVGACLGDIGVQPAAPVDWHASLAVSERETVR
jgi:hypothetical protein